MYLKIYEVIVDFNIELLDRRHMHQFVLMFRTTYSCAVICISENIFLWRIVDPNCQQPRGPRPCKIRPWKHGWSKNMQDNAGRKTAKDLRLGQKFSFSAREQL